MREGLTPNNSESFFWFNPISYILNFKTSFCETKLYSKKMKYIKSGIKSPSTQGAFSLHKNTKQYATRNYHTITICAEQTA